MKEKYAEEIKTGERKDFQLEDDLFDETENDILHEKAIKENKRADGRTMDEVRELICPSRRTLKNSSRFRNILSRRHARAFCS